MNLFNHLFEFFILISTNSIDLTKLFSLDIYLPKFKPISVFTNTAILKSNPFKFSSNSRFYLLNSPFNFNNSKDIFYPFLKSNN